MTAQRIGFVGRRLADKVTYERTVRLYRDVLGLTVSRTEGDRSTRFVLGDGSGLHLYGPGDRDHLGFGDHTCIGLVVDDVDAMLDALVAAGSEILDDPIQRDGIEAWFHYRAPDGSVQEILGADRRSGRDAPRRPRQADG